MVPHLSVILNKEWRLYMLEQGVNVQSDIDRKIKCTLLLHMELPVVMDHTHLKNYLSV